MLSVITNFPVFRPNSGNPVQRGCRRRFSTQ